MLPPETVTFSHQNQTARSYAGSLKDKKRSARQNSILALLGIDIGYGNSAFHVILTERQAELLASETCIARLEPVRFSRPAVWRPTIADEKFVQISFIVRTRKKPTLNQAGILYALGARVWYMDSQEFEVILTQAQAGRLRDQSWVENVLELSHTCWGTSVPDRCLACAHNCTIAKREGACVLPEAPADEHRVPEGEETSLPIVFLNLDSLSSQPIQLKVGQTLALIRNIIFGGDVLHGLDLPVSHFAVRPQINQRTTPLPGLPDNTCVVASGEARLAGSGHIVVQFAPPNPGSRPFRPVLVSFTVS